MVETGHKRKCREYYQKNKERIKLQNAKRYCENREEILQQKREYSQKLEVKERIRKYQKKYRENHREENKGKRKNYLRNYYLENRERILKQGNQHRKNNADRINARKRELRKENRERFSKYDFKHYQKRKHLYTQIKLMDDPFPDEIVVEYHHPYPQLPFTIPMPRDIHQTYNMHLNRHIEYNKDWFAKLYSMDVDELLGLKNV